MVKIKYNDGTILESVTFKRTDEHIVTIGGGANNTSGFKAYSGDKMLGDYSTFTTIYRELDNAIQYSNDGSIYHEPTTTIFATFDGEKPESIDITLSNGTTDTLREPFRKEYVGDRLFVVEATNLDDYNISLMGAEVRYTLKSEAQKIEEEVRHLHWQLSSDNSPLGDWKEIKQIGTHAYTDEEMQEYRNQRQAIRDRLNELENKG